MATKFSAVFGSFQCATFGLMILLLGQFVYCQDTYVPANTDPDYPNTCFSDDNTQWLQQDSTQMGSDNCGYTTCIMMDGTLYWETRQCPQQYVPADCSTTVNQQNVFPDCCPQLNC